jgi:LysM repeat protein
MKFPFRPQKKKKFNAATARRAREADYIEEPNVKLSSAFVVVLLLHLVAVGGIFAFKEIQTHQPAQFEETETAQPQQPAQAVANADTTDNSASDAQPAASPAAVRIYRVKIGDTIAKIASANGVTAADIIDMNKIRETGGIHVGEDLKLPVGAVPTEAQAPKPATPKDSGGTYTVVRGDTPVSIARKLHVGYDDLLRLNKIEDPKKLKIGLKLKVPAKHPTA